MFSSATLSLIPLTVRHHHLCLTYFQDSTNVSPDAFFSHAVSDCLCIMFFFSLRVLYHSVAEQPW